jgi:hypothetical protein
MQVFIAGPRTISRLEPELLKHLDTLIDNGYTILIGDSIGIDKVVQEFWRPGNTRRSKFMPPMELPGSI